MVTNKNLHNSQYVELEGESRDTKPTENIGANSKFYELDTKDEYYFDATSSTWKKVGGD